MDTIGIPFRDENREIYVKEEDEMGKHFDMFEQEDNINRFVSTSSSLQTIISKTETQIKSNLSQMEQSESEYGRKFTPGVNLSTPEEEWI